MNDFDMHEYYHGPPSPERKGEDECEFEHATVRPTSKRVDYEPDIPFYVLLESHLAENAMSTRSFPTLKPQKYDPQAMATALEKAKAEGKKVKQAEEEEDYHKVMHRHQTQSFEIHKDLGEEDDEKIDEEER